MQKLQDNPPVALTRLVDSISIPTSGTTSALQVPEKRTAVIKNKFILPWILLPVALLSILTFYKQVWIGESLVTVQFEQFSLGGGDWSVGCANRSDGSLIASVEGSGDCTPSIVIYAKITGETSAWGSSNVSIDLRDFKFLVSQDGIQKIVYGKVVTADSKYAVRMHSKE